MRSTVKHWCQRYVNPTNAAAVIVFFLTIVLGVFAKW